MSGVEGGLIGIAEIEGRGRSLVASHPLKQGQILLTDSPILLYSTLPLQLPQPPPPPLHRYCSHCFRILHPSAVVVSCPSCSALFCNPNCQSLSLSSSHSPWVCQSLSHLKHRPPSPQLHHQVRFLIAAYNLAAVSPSDFRILLSLQGESPPHPDDSTLFLHSLISSLSPPSPVAGFGFSVELTAALLSKDKLNSFGLMEPFSEEGERSVRAYGIYPKASFFNHDCLPNACRFDYVDTAPDSNTDIVVRAIHDVPRGREICLSYFPVNLNYSERQSRLRDDYGFTCGCDRCKVEANWSEDEEGDEVIEEEEEAMDEDEDGDEDMESSEGGGGGVIEEDDFPHSYFFVRYMCDRKNCWGTLAPLPPTDSSTPSTVMECNVCGNLKNDEATIDGDALNE